MGRQMQIYYLAEIVSFLFIYLFIYNYKFGEFDSK